MIHGILVATKSGLPVASIGLEGDPVLLSGLLVAVGTVINQGLKSEISKVEFQDKDLIIAGGGEKSAVLVAILADRDDLSAEFLAKSLLYRITHSISEEELEFVTGELQAKVEEIIKKYER